jgi:endonuclease-3
VATSLQQDLETLNEVKGKALTVHRRLIVMYGRRLPGDHTLDPLSQLINTILSQNTSDVNRDRAFDTLRSRFPTWEHVRAAGVPQIEDAIRIGGLAAIKAPRIKAILDRIHRERGDLSLEFLEDQPVTEARDWLTSLKGVGHKTASCVLLFAMGKPAFPVDTHVHRVTRRLGLVPVKSSPQRTHQLIEAMVAPELYYPLHLNLITHGRRVCKSQRPRCYDCRLEDLCDFADKHMVPPE